MDELARRAIGDLNKRLDFLVEHQNRTDKTIKDLMEAIDRLTQIAARLAGVA